MMIYIIILFLGIIPRAIVHIFEGKESDEDQENKYIIYKHWTYMVLL